MLLHFQALMNEKKKYKERKIQIDWTKLRRKENKLYVLYFK